MLDSAQKGISSPMAGYLSRYCQLKKKKKKNRPQLQEQQVAQPMKANCIKSTCISLQSWSRLSVCDIHESATYGVKILCQNLRKYPGNNLNVLETLQKKIYINKMLRWKLLECGNDLFWADLDETNFWVEVKKILWRWIGRQKQKRWKIASILLLKDMLVYKMKIKRSNTWVVKTAFLTGIKQHGRSAQWIMDMASFHNGPHL